VPNSEQGDAVGRSGSTAGWPSSWNLGFDIASRRGTVHRGDHSLNSALDPGPARCGEHHDGELPRGEVLLILQIRVGSRKNRESFFLGGVEQLSVLELRPASLVSGYYFMLGKHPP